MKVPQALTMGGVTRTLAQWARLIGVTAHGIRTRLRAGATPEKALRPARMGRPARMITIGGETLPLEVWATRKGVSAWTIRRRLALKWSESDAVLAPAGARLVKK